MATQCAIVVLNKDYTMCSRGPLTMASQCGSQWSFICPMKQQQKVISSPENKQYHTTCQDQVLSPNSQVAREMSVCFLLQHHRPLMTLKHRTSALPLQTNQPKIQKPQTNRPKKQKNKMADRADLVGLCADKSALAFAPDVALGVGAGP